MLLHYVEYLFLYPGTISHITKISEIPERNPSEIAVPEGCTGFRFLDKEVGIGDPLKYKNASGWYYCNCEKITIEDARKIFCGNKQYEPLENYVKAKGIEYVVKTKSRHYIPLRSEDTVL